jgi:DNA-binding MarR family transcriptional regulator
MVTSIPKNSLALDRTFTHRLHTLSKDTDRITQAAYQVDAGIAFSEGRCLAAIGAFRPLSVNDLASRAAQSLVEQGLVHKDTSATDRRGVVLTLTTQGEGVWQRVMAVIERRNEEIVSCLTTAERQQLDDLLDRLISHAKTETTLSSETPD